MAQYKQTKRLQKSKAISKKRIRRAQKASDDIDRSKKAGMGVKAIADFGSSLLGAAQSVDAATAPNETAWDSYEEGRQEVGLERTDSDLGFFQKLGRKLKGPDLSENYSVSSDFKDSVTGDMMTKSHMYTGAELSSIGKEVLSGTAQQTLKKANTENWSDIFGKKGPGGLKAVSSDGKAPSMSNNVGKTLNSSVQNTPKGDNILKQGFDYVTGPRNNLVSDRSLSEDIFGLKGTGSGNILERLKDSFLNKDASSQPSPSGASKPVTTDASTTETTPTDSMADAWKSQYQSLDAAAVSRNRGETSFGEIDQYGINEALKLSDGDWSKAGQMWGSDKWLESMKKFNT